MDRQRGWQTAKRILKKNKDPNKTLMDYRNTEFQGIRTSALDFENKLTCTRRYSSSGKNNQHVNFKPERCMTAEKKGIFQMSTQRNMLPWSPNFRFQNPS